MYKRTYKHKRKELIYSFTNREYTEILSKFRGCLIFRGKSSLSYKWIDKIFLKFKRTFGIDTDFLVKKVMRTLIPFIGYKKVKMGKKVHPLPILLKKNKRYTLLINWLLKDSKNKSNVRGYKFKDIWENFYDGLYNTGSIADKRDDYFDKSLEFLYLLRKHRKNKRFFAKNPFYKKIFKDSIDKFYEKNKGKIKIQSKRPIRQLKLLVTRFCKFKYKFKKNLYVNNLFKSKIKSLWFNNQLKYNDKSKFMVDFILKNKKYIKLQKLIKSRLVIYYLKKKNEKKTFINKI